MFKHLLNIFQKVNKTIGILRKLHPLDETHLDTVRGLIELRGFQLGASISGAPRSDAATSDKDKQICFMLMPRT